MEILDLDIKYNEDGLIPAIIQDEKSNEVLMMAYMNGESLKRTMETGLTHFWSRSRKKLWQKGETSGNTQTIKSISLDCDGDTLLVKVIQKGGACHTGNRTCFFRELDGEGLSFGENEKRVFDPNTVYGASILKKVYDVVMDRKENPKEGSYTNYLFEKGIDKILKKVGEESAEVIIAAKNREKSEVTYEVADLFYHIIVTLVEQGVSLGDIYEELEGRYK